MHRTNITSLSYKLIADICSRKKAKNNIKEFKASKILLNALPPLLFRNEISVAQFTLLYVEE
jgi:hypothetical protein